MLHELLTEHHDELVARTRAKVALRTSPRVTNEELQKGVPLLLRQLVDSLRRAEGESESNPAIGKDAGAHGRELSRAGFNVAQVVHDYGDVCQAVTELAVETRAPITSEEFHTFNRCLDDAIAGAVTGFSLQQAQVTAETATERLGILAHELRNLVTTATLSFEIIRKGTVGIGGSTGDVLRRSLQGLRDLIDRSMAQVRLEAGIEHKAPLSLRDFLGEMEATSGLEATALGHRLDVIAPEDCDVEIAADRQLLASMVSNLLQNAFKYSHAGSTIILRAHCTADRVILDVEDECGGLPPGKAEELFRPFEQRGADRSGLGLGLAITFAGATAHGGALRVRDVPGHGCVFTLDLPRASVP